VPGPAFLTGGSGFVGGELLRRLVAEGRDVRALARSVDAASIIERAGAQVIRGDLFDDDALLEGMRGCEVVFHVAGRNAMCVGDPEGMLRTNVDGTEAVVRAAHAASVPRVVHTSSAAVIGEPAGAIGREDTPHRGSFLSTYERSKFLAERSAFALGRELGIDVVAVCPSSVQGPGRSGGSARLLIKAVDARLPALVDTFLSIVDVDDCTTGHILAETRAMPGARYLLNGASLTTARALALVRSVAGRPRHVIRLPRGAVAATGAIAGRMSRLTGRPIPFCPELARTLLHGHRYDGSRATTALGLTYRPVEETIERTLAWYADHGLINPLRPEVGVR
jgi:dihydroflavonol-4-reductase